MKYPSHGFLASRWFDCTEFIDLSNSLEVIVHYLLIGRMVGFGHQEEFTMVSVLACVVTH